MTGTQSGETRLAQQAGRVGETGEPSIGGKVAQNSPAKVQGKYRWATALGRPYDPARGRRIDLKPGADERRSRGSLLPAVVEASVEVGHV
jgi:hypothetical protein